MKTLGFALAVLLCTTAVSLSAQTRLSTTGTTRPSTTGTVRSTTGTLPTTTGSVRSTTGTLPSTTGTATTGTVRSTTGTLPSSSTGTTSTGGSVRTTSSTTIFTGTPLYITFNSHNEEDDYSSISRDSYQNSTVFSTLRPIIKDIADKVRTGGAKWDWQSDWRFLKGTSSLDPQDASTNYKTIVRWLAEDNSGAIEVTPHAHENDYNYADVAYLFNQLGITPAPVVGGFTYNAAQGTGGGAYTGYTWDSLARGLQGRAYPATTWTPQILWGGASVNTRTGMTDHGNDLHALGIWKPTSPSNFFTNAPANSLILLGNGYENLLTDTTSAATIVANVLATLDSVSHYPAGAMYSCAISIHQKYFTSSGYADKIAQIITALRSYTASGQLVWATHTEKAALWSSTYGSVANYAPYYEGYTPTSSSSSSSRPPTSSVTVRTYPNPASSTLNVSISGVPFSASSVRVRLLTTLGSEVAAENVSTSTPIVTFDVSALTNGSYIVEVTAGTSLSRSTVIVNH